MAGGTEAVRDGGSSGPLPRWSWVHIGAHIDLLRKGRPKFKGGGWRQGCDVQYM